MKRIRTINVKIGCASGYSECFFRTKTRRIIAENKMKSAFRNMRNIRNHTRTSVIKVKFSKAVNGVCKLYSSLQRKLAERFEDDDNVQTFETNVKVDELPIDGTFTSDFLVKFKDGSFKVYECVLRRHITKPHDDETFIAFKRLLDEKRRWFCNSYGD